jgi:hypothetical protein
MTVELKGNPNIFKRMFVGRKLEVEGEEHSFETFLPRVGDPEITCEGKEVDLDSVKIVFDWKKK